jgi:hypothetical protein
MFKSQRADRSSGLSARYSWNARIAAKEPALSRWIPASPIGRRQLAGPWYVTQLVCSPTRRWARARSRVNCRLDVEKVQPKTGEVERRGAEAARSREILEDALPEIVMKAVELRLEVGDHEVGEAVAVQVSSVDPIPPSGRPSEFRPAPESSEMSSNRPPPRFRKRKFIVVSLAPRQPMERRAVLRPASSQFSRGCSLRRLAGVRLLSAAWGLL